MEELRAYFFVNMYLSGIHAGIQAQHCTAEMFARYDKARPDEKKVLHDWANEHKTTILLNAGYQSELHKITALLINSGYPWAVFGESVEALNGATTCSGVILPKKMYSYRLWKDTPEEALDIGSYEYRTEDGILWSYSLEELELIYKMSKLKLMT